MKRTIGVKFGWFAAALLTALPWNAAQAQIRPPGMPRPPGFGPRMNPPGFNPRLNPPGFPRGGDIMVKVWKCTGCGQEIGRGLSVPPSTCPHCGAHLINGVGNGIRQPGLGGGMVNPNPPFGGPMNPPGFNPVPPGPVNPPVFNPQPTGPMNPPVFNPPPVNQNPPNFDPNPVVVNVEQPGANAPFVNPAPVAEPAANGADSSTTNTTASPTGSGSSGNWRLVAVVAGIIVVGVFVLAGGTFLMIFTLKSSNSSSSRRRRRRDDDYDD